MYSTGGPPSYSPHAPFLLSKVFSLLTASFLLLVSCFLCLLLTAPCMIALHHDAFLRIVGWKLRLTIFSIAELLYRHFCYSSSHFHLDCVWCLLYGKEKNGWIRNCHKNFKFDIHFHNAFTKNDQKFRIGKSYPQSLSLSPNNKLQLSFY